MHRYWDGLKDFGEVFEISSGMEKENFIMMFKSQTMLVTLKQMIRLL